MQVERLADGLWRWTAPAADGEVGCVYAEVAGGIVLVDPVTPTRATDLASFWRALDRDVARLGAPHVLLTSPLRSRPAGLLERYAAARLWIAPGAAGATLPEGLTAIAGAGTGDVLAWLPAHGALACGDSLVGVPGGIALCPTASLAGPDPATVRAELRGRLAGLPVQRLLPRHGPPLHEGARAALDRALA